MVVVKVHRPVMVMVYHRYWYRTNNWYWDLSYNRLIDWHGLNYPLNQGASDRSYQRVTQSRSHYRRA